jgi:hypothetical protein
MHQCPVCREQLPNEYWRILADHAACQRPVPSAPKADHLQESGGVSLVTQGINRLRNAVEEVVAAINPSIEIKKLDQ